MILRIQLVVLVLCYKQLACLSRGFFWFLSLRSTKLSKRFVIFLLGWKLLWGRNVPKQLWIPFSTTDVSKSTLWLWKSNGKFQSLHFFIMKSEAYSEPSRTSKMELFAKIVNHFGKKHSILMFTQILPLEIGK